MVCSRLRRQRSQDSAAYALQFYGVSSGVSRLAWLFSILPVDLHLRRTPGPVRRFQWFERARGDAILSSQILYASGNFLPVLLGRVAIAAKPITILPRQPRKLLVEECHHRF